jgi:flavin reductase (DIM6/NTAB) family NADH-FMN oxidoreductase RutF
MTSDIVAADLRSSPALVTTSSNGELAGSLVRFHTQCGVDPIQYAVWVPTLSHTRAISRGATHVALHILDDSGHALEEVVTPNGDVPPGWFDQRAWRPGPGGVPLLTSYSCHLVLGNVVADIDRGGYTCLIGELVQAVAHRDIAAPASSGHGNAGADPWSTASEDRRDARHVLAAMDAETRRLFINAAVGAGHAIELPDDR